MRGVAGTRRGRLAGCMSDSGGTSTYPSTDLDLDLRWWAAANYLTIGQIYLRDNALLREPLVLDHVKPRLLGHWGTSPGLSMIYALLNRVIRERDGDWLYVTGPGHGGPALVAAAWLEGTYSEVYPHVADDAEGIRTLFRQFSSPGGVPSHVSVQTPGSIHEGGELGYALAHAAGAAFDHPDLVVACVVGDGEAETGPLAASWRLPTFLNPRRDGAVLPILHLNGYKIAGPTVLGRTSDEDVEAYLRSQGWDPVTVAGDDPRAGVPGAAGRPARRPRLDPLDPGRGARAATGRASRCGTSGRPSSCAPRRAGPARTSSTASRSRARTSATRSRCRAWPRTPSTCGCSRSGCAPTDPGTCSTPTAASPPSCGRWRPRATAGCRRRPTPTADGCARSCRCPRSTATRSRSTHPASPWSRTPSPPGGSCATCMPRRPAPTAAAPSGCSPRTRRRATGCSRCSR